MQRHRIATWLMAAALFGSAAVGLPGTTAGQQPKTLPELKLAPPSFHPPTLGGKLLWTDEYFFQQWRIQRNVRSGQFRLLDGNDVQYAAGGYVECRAKLEEIRRKENLQPIRGKVVIVLHGLFRSRTSMSKLCRHLHRKGGYTVLNVTYASTQQDVARHARALDKIVSQLDQAQQINFVGHSLGNIVVRKYLYDQAHRKDGRPGDTRIGRFVMLAPPNHGSVLAVALSENVLYSALTGDAGQQLGRRWQELGADLGTPPCQFGVIAGGLGNDHGLNPLIPGDDDGTVAVASTRLTGAADFARVTALHSFIMNDSDVLQYTLRFLQEGCFVSPEKRQPIQKDDS